MQCLKPLPPLGCSQTEKYNSRLLLLFVRLDLLLSPGFVVHASASLVILKFLLYLANLHFRDSMRIKSGSIRFSLKKTRFWYTFLQESARSTLFLLRSDWPTRSDSLLLSNHGMQTFRSIRSSLLDWRWCSWGYFWCFIRNCSRSATCIEAFWLKGSLSFLARSKTKTPNFARFSGMLAFALSGRLKGAFCRRGNYVLDHRIFSKSLHSWV